MNVREILGKTDHRLLPMPSGKWIIYQEWHEVIFVHWPVKPGLLSQLIPGELKIQTFKGTAWISLVAFRLAKVRLRHLPPVPLIPSAVEINIRTYVEFSGKPGIYFLNMELGKPVSSLLAKHFSGLPYRFSKTAKTASGYRSVNKYFNDEMDIEYEIKSKIAMKTDLDLWLTERYALFQKNKNQNIIEYEVHHNEWTLHDVNIKKYLVRYDRFGDLLHKKPEHIQFSPGVEVLTWGRKDHRVQ